MLANIWAAVKGWFTPPTPNAITELDLTTIPPMAGGAPPALDGHCKMLGLGL